MEYPKKILFATDGVVDDIEALVQALGLARANSAHLTILVVFPPLPEAMRDYQEPYENGLRTQTEEKLQSSAARLGLDLGQLEVAIVLDSGTPSAQRILEFVSRHSYDMVIKQAEPTKDGRGFKSKDMALVRKCATPVWLYRPSQQKRPPSKVAVAIDPESVDEESHELSLRLLRLGQHLAESSGTRLEIVSCWDYPFEGYLHSNSWFQVGRSELNSIVHGVRVKHAAALDSLIKESGILQPYHVEHLKGQPETILPDYAGKRRVNLLVMGSLARTGVAGLLIGNTSEDVMRRLKCSILTLKPSGFISPVQG